MLTRVDLCAGVGSSMTRDLANRFEPPAAVRALVRRPVAVNKTSVRREGTRLAEPFPAERTLVRFFAAVDQFVTF